MEPAQFVTVWYCGGCEIYYLVLGDHADEEKHCTNHGRMSPVVYEAIQKDVTVEAPPITSLGAEPEEGFETGTALQQLRDRDA